MRLNGWRRLWLVALLLSLGWFGLIYPWSVVYHNVGDWKYTQAIERDYASRECLISVNSDFASLNEPPFDEDGGKCWHLYTLRKFDIGRFGDKVPYTLAVYRENHLAERRGMFQQVALGGSIATIIFWASFT